MNFLSKDKKQVNLPVAIGDTVYSYWLECFNGCILQRELFDKHFAKTNEGRCGVTPCHTILDGIKKEELSLRNLEPILTGWNERYFANEEEAFNKANEIIQKNREVLLELGFTLK